MLIKHWAKRRRVNDAYTGTLSSYAYCLMAIAHLQQRRPPVLPVLQEGAPTKRQTIGAQAVGCIARSIRSPAIVMTALSHFFTNTTVHVLQGPGTATTMTTLRRCAALGQPTRRASQSCWHLSSTSGRLLTTTARRSSRFGAARRLPRRRRAGAACAPTSSPGPCGAAALENARGPSHVVAWLTWYTPSFQDYARRHRAPPGVHRRPV